MAAARKSKHLGRFRVWSKMDSALMESILSLKYLLIIKMSYLGELIF